jgi:dTDP-4-amino-4,6-dideoxygalactose transaminase
MSGTQLAIEGGTPTFSAADVASRWPVWDSHEEAALLRVLHSGVWCRIKQRWDEGEAGEFEREFRNYAGACYAIAVANGTVAIELAIRALGIGPGDEVLVPASTFFGSVTPVLQAGAVPVFVDSNPDTLLMDPASLTARIGPRTRAVIAVHLYGLPVDLDRVVAVCRQHSLALIEDCAQAMGSRWRGQHVGTFGEVGCFSFQQDKALNAGEGGAVATQQGELAGRLFAFQNGYPVDGAPRQNKYEVSTNGRITPWQAAILRCQLTRIDQQNERRLANASQLFARLDGTLPLEPVYIPPAATRWNIYSCPLRYHGERAAGLSRDDFLRVLRAEGIPASEGHTDPVYRRPLFRQGGLNFRNDGCPFAERIADEQAVVLGQRFLLGPETWVDRLVSVLSAIQRSAPRLVRRFGT